VEYSLKPAALAAATSIVYCVSGSNFLKKLFAVIPTKSYIAFGGGGGATRPLPRNGGVEKLHGSGVARGASGGTRPWAQALGGEPAHFLQSFKNAI